MILKRNSTSLPTLMNELFKPDCFGGVENYNAYAPAVNIKESETGFELVLSVPGRKKEDFNLEVDKLVLTISNELEKTELEEGVKFTRKEFALESFKRAFTLPDTINIEGIDASYEDGILRVVLPKKEEALPKPKRLIELS